MNRKETELLVENWRRLLKGQEPVEEEINELFKGKFLGKNPVEEIKSILQSQIKDNISEIEDSVRGKNIHEIFHKIKHTVRNLNFKFEIYNQIVEKDLKLTKVPKKLNLENVVSSIYTEDIPDQLSSFKSDLDQIINAIENRSKKILAKDVKKEDLQNDIRLNKENFRDLFYSIVNKKNRPSYLKLNLKDGDISRILKDRILKKSEEQNIKIDKSYSK